MRIILSTILAILLLTGCSTQSDGVSEALQLRQRLTKGEGASFVTAVTADYGDRIYTFTMECVAKSTGAVDFTVVSPETISGIRGTVSEGVGKLTFDDKVLLFEPLTQGQLTPAIGPWLMIKAIQGGYIRSLADADDCKEITFDDTLGSENYQLVLTLGKDQTPTFCQVFWNNRRILSLTISDFKDM